SLLRQASPPSSSSPSFGARGGNAGVSHFAQRSGGSTMWESLEIIGSMRGGSSRGRHTREAAWTGRAPATYGLVYVLPHAGRTDTSQPDGPRLRRPRSATRERAVLQCPLPGRQRRHALGAAMAGMAHLGSEAAPL